MHESDEALIARTADSDLEAFRMLFERYQPILLRHLVYHLRDDDAAHDVVQETFLRVWQHRTGLRPSLSFLAYLFRISGNLVRDRARHTEVRTRLQDQVVSSTPSAGDNPESAAHYSLLHEHIALVVRENLPPRCREIFLLSRLEGMSNTEISHALRISVKTVENQLTRAIKILRKHLGPFVE